MEAECFENTVSVPAGVRLAIVLCHRYPSLLGGQPADRGASGTFPSSSRNTGRVGDVWLFPALNLLPAKRSLARGTYYLESLPARRRRSLARLACWQGFPQDMWSSSNSTLGHDKIASDRTAMRSLLGESIGEPFDCRISSRDQSCLESGPAAPCLIVKYGAWCELRLGVVRWQRL